ncbi:MAG: hypothetical protein ACP5LU_07750 [Desulfurella sp.]
MIVEIQNSRISKLVSLRNDIVEYRKRILSIIEQNKNEQNK